MQYIFFCFTEDGKKICQKLKECLPFKTFCTFYTIPRLANESIFHALTQPLSFYINQWFFQSDAIFFISACGIAVRSIAPFIKDKTGDPAVLVIDDTASYVIPLLSGHIGGANELAVKIATILGAIPVITTSTDRHQVFSVDSFARKNKLFMRILSDRKETIPWQADTSLLSIYNPFSEKNQQRNRYPKDAMELAKKISSNILQNKKVYWNCSFYFKDKKEKQTISYSTCCTKNSTKEEVPNGVFPIMSEEEISDDSVCISVDITKNIPFKEKFAQTLLLIPQIVHIGIGCKKNISTIYLLNAFFSFLSLHSLCLESISGIASIELKKEEKALLQLSNILQLPFKTFSSEKLLSISGEFTSSEFVNSVTGVDNVCERSAVCAAGNGKLIIKKIVLENFNGITFAAAIENFYLK